MPATALLEIPQEILDSARMTPDQLLVELAVHLYEQCRLSIGKAHELAGLSLWEFRQLLALRQIPPHFDTQDLEQELEAFVISASHDRRQQRDQQVLAQAGERRF